MIGALISRVAYGWHRLACGWYIGRNARKARYHALKRDQWEPV